MELWIFDWSPHAHGHLQERTVMLMRSSSASFYGSECCDEVQDYTLALLGLSRQIASLLQLEDRKERTKCSTCTWPKPPDVKVEIMWRYAPHVKTTRSFLHGHNSEVWYLPRLLVKLKGELKGGLGGVQDLHWLAAIPHTNSRMIIDVLTSRPKYHRIQLFPNQA